MTDQNSNSPAVPDQGGFIAGFSIGLLAGAAGYFLFGTKRGAEIRHELVKEWENAQEHLAKEGVISSQPLSLRNFLQNLSEEVFHASLPTELMSSLKPKKLLKPAARKGKRDSSAKFSGV